MTTPRFFVPPETLRREPLTLEGELAHQLSRVLRLRAGARLTLLDDSGQAYEVELDEVSPTRARAHLVAVSIPQSEPGVRLVLYQALLREAKFDLVLQKGTEVGVAAFVPLLAERSLVGKNEGPTPARQARWERIVREAAEQSGRARLPRLLPAQSVAVAARVIPAGALSLLATVGTATRALGVVLRAADENATREVRRERTRSVHLFIGPEGDFSPAEVAAAIAAGAIPISLGPRVLRAETAGLVALAAILYALGELG
jgi:16S rRNA (uracil1498-N3)-methyltransferase